MLLSKCKLVAQILLINLSVLIFRAAKKSGHHAADLLRAGGLRVGQIQSLRLAGGTRAGIAGESHREPEPGRRPLKSNCILPKT